MDVKPVARSSKPEISGYDKGFILFSSRCALLAHRNQLLETMKRDGGGLQSCLIGPQVEKRHANRPVGGPRQDWRR